MNRNIGAALALLLGTTLSAYAAQSTPHAECDGTNFGGLVVARAQENLSITTNSVSTLHVAAAKNGGIKVVGWDGDHYEVTACKAAGAADQARAQQLLSQIKLTAHGDQLGVSGPKGENWSANLLIKAPKATAMELHAYNGPIDVDGFAGQMQAETINGPLEFQACSGRMVGSAENGPIDLVGVGGNVNLKAENGPISIKVGGNSWQDGQLDARTTNGPLSLNIPEGFQSGFKVESRRYSPMSCQGDLCQQARKTWDDDVHRIEFGGAPVLNMSTVNGPVEVRSGMAQEAEE